MGIPATYAAGFGMVLALFGYKALLFRFVRSTGLLLGCFFLGVALVVPLTWLTSPDWNNEHVYRIAIWIGDPVAILLIPCLSFLFDYIKGWKEMKYWRIRVPVEVFLAFPAWVYIWALIQLFILDWIWI